MHVTSFSGVVVWWSRVEPKVPGLDPAQYPFFSPLSFFSFLFCFVCLLVLLVMFFKL